MTDQQIKSNGEHVPELRFSVDRKRTYSLGELIDLAEAHNPETRIAWENARAQLAALGVARRELHPTLAAIALSGTNRVEALLGDRFCRQTLQSLERTLELSYHI